MLGEALLIVFQAFFAMLPAYVAGPVAVLTGGGAPMDGGRVWRDDRRILGDGKTWRGLVGGTVGGIALAGILSMAVRASGTGDLTDFLMPNWDTGLSWLWVGFAMAFGSLLGDFVKSFFKRRRGAERGAKSPVMDMYDFILGPAGVALVRGGLLARRGLPVAHAGHPGHFARVAQGRQHRRVQDGQEGGALVRRRWR